MVLCPSCSHQVSEPDLGELDTSVAKRAECGHTIVFRYESGSLYSTARMIRSESDLVSESADALGASSE